MVKFKITHARIAEACSIWEYLSLLNKNLETVVRVAPRFILGEDGEYLVTPNLDDDGDIVSFDGLDAAVARMMSISASRSQKLVDDFAEAAKTIVDPQKPPVSKRRSSTGSKKPPPG